MITNMFNDCYPNLGQCRLETSISFCKLESLSEDQANNHIVITKYMVTYCYYGVPMKHFTRWEHLFNI